MAPSRQQPLIISAKALISSRRPLLQSLTYDETLWPPPSAPSREEAWLHQTCTSAGNSSLNAHRAGVGKAAALPRRGRGCWPRPRHLHSYTQQSRTKASIRAGERVTGCLSVSHGGRLGYLALMYGAATAIDAAVTSRESTGARTAQAATQIRQSSDGGWLRGPLSTQPRPTLLQGPITSKELSLGGLHTFSDIERYETRTVVRHCEMLRDNVGELETPGSRATRNSSLGSQSRPNSGRFLARLGEVPVHRLKAWLNAPASE
jgi:hypothetical protein